MKLTLSIFTLLILTTGCDRLCKSTEEDTVGVSNKTGRSLTLTVCKGREGKMAVAVPAAQTALVSLGTSEHGYVQGGTDSLKTCDGNGRNGIVKYDIALAHESFADVKFCHHPQNTDVVIVEPADPCPAGLTEQTTEATCP